MEKFNSLWLPHGQDATGKHLYLPAAREGLFKIAIWFGRKASELNRDLNGSGDTPPPHAQWAVS